MLTDKVIARLASSDNDLAEHTAYSSSFKTRIGLNPILVLDESSSKETLDTTDIKF